MSLTECLEVASIVCAWNGGQMTDLHRRIDPFSAFRACKDKDTEIGRLKTALNNAKQDRPRGNAGGSSYGQRHQGGGGAVGKGGRKWIPWRRTRWRGTRGASQNRSGPSIFSREKNAMKVYNERKGCDRHDVCQRLHKGSVRTGEGQACMADHPNHKHRTTN